MFKGKTSKTKRDTNSLINESFSSNYAQQSNNNNKDMAKKAYNWDPSKIKSYKEQLSQGWPSLSHDEQDKVLNTISTFNPSYKYINLLQQAIELTLPKEFKYSDKKGFFEYAFPEGILEAGKDLSNAGYTLDVINKLMQVLRNTTDSKSFNGTKIYILPAPTNEDTVLPNYSLGQYISKKIKSLAQSDILELPDQTSVIILPLLFKSHWYSILIHLERLYTQELVVNVLINNNYGGLHSEEKQLEELEAEVIKLFKTNILQDKLELKVLLSKEDIQGAYYDDVNCGVLTVHIIEKYMEYAKSNKRIEGYITPILFDQFEDEVLNAEVHKALVLRLKVEQLNMVSKSNYKLCFKDSNVPTIEDAERTRIVEQKVEELSKTIIKSAYKVYDKNIPDPYFLKIMKSNDVKQLHLSNLITENILKNAPINFFSKPLFRDILKSIITNYFEDDSRDSHNPDPDLMDKHGLMYLQMFDQSLGIPVAYRSNVTTDLIELIKKNNFELYKGFIRSLSSENIDILKNEQDQYGHTPLIHAAKLGNEKIVEDLIINIKADPFTKGSYYKVGNSTSGMSLNAIEVSAFEANNIRALELLLKAIPKDDIAGIVTELLVKVLGNWKYYENKSQVKRNNANDKLLYALEDREPLVEGKEGVIDTLLKHGADPFKINIDHHRVDFYENDPFKGEIRHNAFDLIVRSIPSIIEVFLKYFPDKIEQVSKVSWSKLQKRFSSNK